MPESRLFMSSLSRRQLARRRPSRSPLRPTLLMAVLLIVVCAAAFLLGRGGI
jgi:hypothetical protein